MSAEELFFPPHDKETLKEILRQRGAEEAHGHSHPRTHTPAIGIFLGIGESALGVSEGKFTTPAA